MADLEGKPPTIRRLDEAVVNLIAAGEVIQRPVSALKELLENSLDAGANSINVLIREGGLKLIQITDNGHGIRLEDLPIVCERHTTSKLQNFEDLKWIQTMGFRGEALASMSYVAHVTITTMTSSQSHGYRATYKNGIIEGEAIPCAAVKGTQISIENLFYNVPMRKKAFRNPSDEYARILDAMGRFAIHNSHVSFSCRKHGENRSDIHTSPSSPSSPSSLSLSSINAIKGVYGKNVAENLIPLEFHCKELKFSINGNISNANYSSKKTTFILFINDRLVECSSLKRAVENIYTSILPKSSKPFIYLSAKLPTQMLDVNVHPTKREISILNQDKVVDRIQKIIEGLLTQSNDSRTFYSQTRLTKDCSHFLLEEMNCSQSTPPTSKGKKVYANQLVRTDDKIPAGSLHAFVNKTKNVQTDTSKLTLMRQVIKRRRNSPEPTELSSVQEILSEIEQNTHSGLFELVKNCTYVGVADDSFILIQHKTNLYLMNIVNASKEVFRQQVFRRFGSFQTITLSSPAPLLDLIIFALEEEEEEEEGEGEEEEEGRLDSSDGSKQEIAQMNVELLKCKSEMLLEYFSIQIDKNGNLHSLPLVLDNYFPSIHHLPLFLLNLANMVEWDSEKECFLEIANYLAEFYSLHASDLTLTFQNNEKSNKIKESKSQSPSRATTNEESSFARADKARSESKSMEKSKSILETDLGSGSNLSSAMGLGSGSGLGLGTETELGWGLGSDMETEPEKEWKIQHVLFPSFKFLLRPPKTMAKDGTFVQVASLEELYKIFERC